MGDKRCAQGHIYSDSLPECPVCREKSRLQGEGKRKTVTEQRDETLKEDGKSVSPQKEHLPKPADKSPVPPQSPKDHTVVLDADEKKVSKEEIPGKSRRKLVGWIVTYSLDKNGMSFNIYEGKNLIGRGAKNDIIINEQIVSEQHASILYKPDVGKFYLKDLSSVNGTKLNNEELEPDTSREIKDGYKITIAKAFEFYFRTCIPPASV